MPIPDYQSLMLPVLMVSTAGEVRIGAAIEHLAYQLNLMPHERAQLLPSGKQTLFGNRVHWAKTYLTKASLLESTRRGHFQITERGRQVIASHPARIDNDFLNQFVEFRQFKEKSAQGSGQEPSHADMVFRRGTRRRMRSCAPRTNRSRPRLPRTCSTGFKPRRQRSSSG